jgi:hypothetical protein
MHTGYADVKHFCEIYRLQRRVDVHRTEFKADQAFFGRSLQITMAAAIETIAAVQASGLAQLRAMARSPSSEVITRHSRSAGAVYRSPSIVASSRAARDMAA